jgi:hypothetical protein
MRHVLQLDSIPIEDIFKFPLFYKFLSGSSFPHIEFNLEAQKVRINTRHSKLRKQELKKELQTAGIKCELGHSQWFYADSKPILAILEEFFGSAPALSSFELGASDVSACVEDLKKTQQGS